MADLNKRLMPKPRCKLKVCSSNEPRINGAIFEINQSAHYHFKLCLFICTYMVQITTAHYRDHILPKQFLLTLSSSSLLRAASANLTPFFASATARCSPMPLDAPVIKTTFPFKRPLNKLFNRTTYYFPHRLTN